MRKNIIAAACIAAVALVGCASSPTEHVSQTAEQRKVIQNNKAQPAWATDFTKKQEGGKQFVIKMVEKVYRLDVGIEQAKTQAMGEAAQLIGTKIAKIATTAMTGDNSVADGVSQSIDSAVHAVSALSMTGIEQADLYWEKIKGEEGKKDYFNIYILVSMPTSEVDRAKQLFLSKLGENKQLESLKDKVEKAVEEMD